MGRLMELNLIRVKEIGGQGLWIGVELRPEAGEARWYCEALKETHVNTVRLAPPLVITRNEIDWAVARIAEVLA